MQRWISFSVCFLLLNIFTVGTCFGLTLSEDGRTPYVIVTAKGATDAEVTAAKELAEFLKKVTQCKFVIITEADVCGQSKRIFVGQSEAVKSMLPDMNWKQLGQDGIVIKTIGDDLILAGGRPRGTLYAVYTFLEDTVGCRWWTSSESYIPSKNKLEIPSLDIVYTPKFYYRDALFADVYARNNYKFMARMKLNGHHQSVIPKAYGGHRDIIGFVHTFYTLLPPSKYFKTHPEWYSLAEGKRTSGHSSQLCLTNKEMRQELIKNALKWLKNNPDQNIISISQNDGGASGACQCGKCVALVKCEGSQAGPLLDFVNKVAQELEKRYPNVMVETLAYAYTTKPPRYIRPRRNVIIRLCDISANCLKPLSSNSNKVFAREMKFWSKITPRLFVWDYPVNFWKPWAIHPNIDVLGPNLRFFADNKVVGVFEQGHGNCRGEFSELKVWLLGHLMWNPYQDDKKLIAEFLNGYYGPAGKYIAKYMELMRTAFARDDVYMTCFNVDFTALKLADMNGATKLFNDAFAAVKGDTKYEDRVLRTRIPLDLMWITKWNDLKAEAKRTNQPFGGPENPSQAIKELVACAKRVGVSRIKADYLEKLLDIPASNVPARTPAALIDLKGKPWIDVQEKQFRCQVTSPQCWLGGDSFASDGVAAIMPGNHRQWSVQYDLKHEGRYRYYVVVRCDIDKKKPKAGVAFSSGIHPGNKKVIIPVAMLADEKYHAYDLGVHEANGQYLWVAPAMNPSVKNVYVDRIILVKE